MSRKRVALYDPATKTMRWGWKDEGPSYARAAGTRGELVVGVSEREMERTKHRRARERAA